MVIVNEVGQVQRGAFWPRKRLPGPDPNPDAGNVDTTTDHLRDFTIMKVGGTPGKPGY